MRNTTLCVFLLLSTGCFVTSADPTGKLCDDAHGCPDGLTCVAGACITATDCGSQTGQPCTVGKGECARTGVYQCTSGVLACDAQPGTPRKRSATERTTTATA
jgi:hypothetical protein